MELSSATSTTTWGHYLEPLARRAESAKKPARVKCTTSSPAITGLFTRRLADDPITLEELSGEFDISRERVRQIEVRAFEKVQAAVKAGLSKIESLPPPSARIAAAEGAAAR